MKCLCFLSTLHLEHRIKQTASDSVSSCLENDGAVAHYVLLTAHQNLVIFYTYLDTHSKNRPFLEHFLPRADEHRINARPLA